VDIIKLFNLLRARGYNASIDRKGYISVPMITKNEHNTDIYNNNIEYSVAKSNGRLFFMLITDISYVCGVESSLDDLAGLSARFMMNHNPNKLDLDMQHGVFAIRQIRKMGLFQTANITMELFVEYMETSKKALQWIIFRSNGVLYRTLWPDEAPPEQFHMMEWNR
jgi:hypothetical protein